MISSFPVMDGDKVAGVVSDREIFVTLFKILEAGQERTRITLRNVALERGTLTKVSSKWSKGRVQKPAQFSRSRKTVPTRSEWCCVWKQRSRPWFIRPCKMRDMI